MIKKAFRLLLLLVLLGTGNGFGQSDDPNNFLEANYPGLMNIFREDISKYNAHYVFAVDVSGSMDINEATVLPCLRNFIQALPDGDRMSIIPFGTEAKTSIFGYSVEISAKTKQDMIMALPNLYNNPNYASDFKDHTDFYKSVQAISDKIRNNPCQVVVTVIFSDFQNNIVTPNSSNFRILQGSELNDMTKNYSSSVKDSYVRNIAVVLNEKGGDPKDLPGYCLDQLKDEVFKGCENGTEIIDAHSSSQTLQNWFEQLRREIQMNKLKAIIDSENKAGNVSVVPQIDIDGNVIADIKWSPTRLYQVMHIDSTFISSSKNFYFVNDTANYGNTRDHEQSLRLGQIKNIKWGLRPIKDNLELGISLPTQFDTELAKLGVSKPVVGTQAWTDRLIFTFLLPFRWTVAIIALIILYIILVIRAMVINARDKMNGKVIVCDEYGDPIDLYNNKKFTKLEGIDVGQGAGFLRIDEAEWAFQVTKVKPSPLLLFCKPYYKWSVTKGFVKSGTKTSGRLDYTENTSVSLKCGIDKENQTHSIKVKMIEPV